MIFYVPVLFIIAILILLLSYTIRRTCLLACSLAWLVAVDAHDDDGGKWWSEWVEEEEIS